MTDDNNASFLSDSELDKLEEELLPRLVTEFRLVAQAQQIVIPEECDDFIKRCLRVKDFNKEKALELSKQFRIASMEFRKWETPFSPSLLHQGIFNKVMFMLSKRDLAGRRILLVNMGAWDPNEISFQEFLTAMILILQFATYEHLESQRKGVILVGDFSGLSTHQAWNIGVKRLIQFLSWMQKGVICRIKALHYVFQPSIISLIYGAVKPFLTAKMQQRMIFHGNHLSTLHNHVEPSVLPPNLRVGNKSSRNATYEVGDFRDTEFHERLLQQDSFFKTWIDKGFPIK